MAAAAFLRNLIAAVPYRLHIVLTDNGIQFTNHDRHIHAFEHIFDRVCRENGIDHRLTRCIVPLRGVTFDVSALEAIWDRFYTV